MVKNGMLQPLDPLPSEWTEGREVEINGAVVPPQELEGLERAFAEVEAVIAQTPDDPEDWKRVEEALAEQKRLGKEYVRRLMGPRAGGPDPTSSAFR